LPTNEDGEFELVLGNRQLLSVFFIVVILLAVFFAMGFIVGRKVSPELAAAPKPEAKPLVVESPVRPTETAKAEPKPERSAPTETAPQQPAAKPEETAKPEPAKQEPAKETKKSKKERAAAAAEAASAQPGAGETYLQLAATGKREADIMVDLLRQKKFKAMAAGVPEKPDLYRVLVGPVPEGSTNKMKTDLQRAGFPGDKAIRRTF
jgi:outer membrane biosynthesis protein TonB